MCWHSIDTHFEEAAVLQAMSGGQPAHAMVMAGAQSARGSPAPGHELQSQPISRTDSHQDPAPQPALTVIMPSGQLRLPLLTLVTSSPHLSSIWNL